MDSNQKQLLKLCKFYEQGHCKFGSSCKFSHYAVNCFLLRHAESKYNHILQSFGNGNTEEAKQSFQMDQKLIDCGLTEKGEEQIKNMDLNFFGGGQFWVQFDIIFVSPLERCLITLDKTLKMHKIMARKIYVLPQLSQVLSKICDFSSQIEAKKQRYRNFSFKYMHQKQRWWQDELVDLCFKGKINVQEKNGKRYLKLLDQIFPQPLQNSQSCLQRVFQAIFKMKAICMKKNAKNILVVSHNRIIKYIMGRNHHGRAESTQNCQFKYTVF